MSLIFISHASQDAVLARKVAAWLAAEGHQQIFLDFDPEKGIPAGIDWEQELYSKLRRARAVVALLSEHSLKSRWCFHELATGRAHGKPIFPIRISPCDVGDILARLQLIELEAGEEDARRRLLAGLRSHGLDPANDFPIDPNRPPYPGLRAFDAEDAGLFFGRADEIHGAIEHLDAMRRGGSDRRLLILMGPSGSGKSSLLKAGILPRLARRPADWQLLPPLRRARSDLPAALAEAFRLKDAAMLTRGAVPAGDALTRHLRNLGAMVAERAQQRLADTGVAGASFLLPLDQAEELFQGDTGSTALDDDAWMLALLRAIIEAPGSPVLMLWTLRTDALGMVQAHPAMADAVFPQTLAFDDLKLGPMSAGALRAIVSEPAMRAGVEIEPALSDQIVADARGANVLPLVAYTLERMWARHHSPLTLKQYVERGGLSRAVRDAADRIVQGLAADSTELAALRAAFVPHLVRVDADGRLRRRPARLDHLAPEATGLLRRFVTERLLVTDRDAAGHETLEVAHEALLDAWPTLARWLEEDRERLHLFDGLQVAAQEWATAGRPDDLLLHRGARLEDVESLTREPRFRPPAGGPGEAYLHACRGAQDARQAATQAEAERRIRDAEQIAAEQRRIARRTGLGLIAALLLAAVAVWQWDRAQANLRVAVRTAERLVTDLAGTLRHVEGVHLEVISRILSQAQELHDDLTKGGENHRSLQWSRGLLEGAMGETFRAQGDLVAALERYRAALAIWERLAAADPSTAELQQNLSVSHNNIANTLWHLGDLPAALERYRAGLLIAERLVATDPRDDRWQALMAFSHFKIGGVLQQQDRLEDALKHHQVAFAIRERLVAAHPDNVEWQNDLSASHTMIGTILQAQEDLPAALESYQAAFAIRDRLAAADDRNTSLKRALARTHSLIASVLHTQGALPASLERYEAALSIFERLAAADPGNARSQIALARSLGLVGEVLRQQGKGDAALSAYRRGLDILQRLRERTRDHKEVAQMIDWFIERIAQAGG